MLVVLAAGSDSAAAPPARMPLTIGLVNNMPADAARATERQFCSLLAAASQRLVVGLRFFTLASGASDATPRHGYGDFARLAASRVDALIVTGAPPVAPRLSQEPTWPALTGLIDLARGRGIPTVWSCLAAHAAVLYLDGIERRLLPRKLSGLAECANAARDHPLMARLPRSWNVPHSRYNELPEPALAAHGYQVLSRSRQAGADMFVKSAGAPFLFFQGHPEYEADTLLREYRRDIGEFLSGARDVYPDMPTGYFDQRTVALLERFREQALRDRRIELMSVFPMTTCRERLGAPWREVAVRIWTNWLAQLQAERLVRRRRIGFGLLAQGAAEEMRLALPHA